MARSVLPANWEQHSRKDCLPDGKIDELLNLSQMVLHHTEGQIAARYNGKYFAIVHNRQVPESPLGDQLHRLADGSRRTDAVWVFRHHLGHFRVAWVTVVSQHFIERIPLCEDAYQPSAIHDHQGADFAGGH